jgi:hypothetical protein
MADHIRYRNGPHRDQRLINAERRLLIAALPIKFPAQQFIQGDPLRDRTRATGPLCRAGDSARDGWAGIPAAAPGSHGGMVFVGS